MDKILESRRLRIVFLLFLGSLLAVAVLTRWLAIGSTADASELKQVVARVLDSFISSSIVTTIIGVIVYVGTSQIREASSQVEILASGDINARFVAAQQVATVWHFKGGLGRYFTSETVPNLLKNGKNGYRFRAYIVDPFNLTLCSYVARHRGPEQTPGLIRNEALVTIVEFVRKVHLRSTSVAEACCGLIDDFASLRIDLCDEGVFITHDKAAVSSFFSVRQKRFDK